MTLPGLAPCGYARVHYVDIHIRRFNCVTCVFNLLLAFNAKKFLLGSSTIQTNQSSTIIPTGAKIRNANHEQRKEAYPSLQGKTFNLIHLECLIMIRFCYQSLLLSGGTSLPKAMVTGNIVNSYHFLYLLKKNRQSMTACSLLRVNALEQRH